MVTGHLDLPGIFVRSVNGNYRNRGNRVLMRLLKIHSNSLPSVLAKGEKVISIIPCRLLTSRWGKIFLLFSNSPEKTDAVMLTSKRVLAAFASAHCASTAWLELNPDLFLYELEKAAPKKKIQFELAKGYPLSIDLYSTPSNPADGRKANVIRKFNENSSYRPPEYGKAFKRLCPKCFNELGGRLTECPHCKSEFYNPISSMLKSIILPALFPIGGSTIFSTRLSVFSGACLLTAIFGFAVLAKPLVGIICSMLTAIIHLSYGYHVYRLLRLCYWPLENKADGQLP